MTPLECIVKTAPSFISGGKDISPEERDVKRAEFIRKPLTNGGAKPPYETGHKKGVDNYVIFKFYREKPEYP